MAAVQVDGLSGTGKSTVCAELIRRGHCAVDADTAFAYFGDPATGRPSDRRVRDNWIWDLSRIRDHCAQRHEDVVFVCGGALNQHRCADLFTRRIRLCVDDDTMRHRLLTRSGNDYGNNPIELAELLALNRIDMAEGRRAGWIVVDATQAIADVTDEVVALARAGAR